MQREPKFDGVVATCQRCHASLISPPFDQVVQNRPKHNQTTSLRKKAGFTHNFIAAVVSPLNLGEVRFRNLSICTLFRLCRKRLEAGLVKGFEMMEGACREVDMRGNEGSCDVQCWGRVRFHCRGVSGWFGAREGFAGLMRVYKVDV